MNAIDRCALMRRIENKAINNAHQSKEYHVHDVQITREAPIYSVVIWQRERSMVTGFREGSTR